MEKLTRCVRPVALFQEVEPIIAALCASSRLCSRLLEKVAAGYYFTLEPSPFSVFDRFPFPSLSSVFRFSPFHQPFLSRIFFNRLLFCRSPRFASFDDETEIVQLCRSTFVRSRTVFLRVEFPSIPTVPPCSNDNA